MSELFETLTRQKKKNKLDASAGLFPRLEIQLPGTRPGFVGLKIRYELYKSHKLVLQ